MLQLVVTVKKRHTVPLKSKLTLETRTSRLDPRAPMLETFEDRVSSRRKENEFRAPDMHVPVIEVNLHDITTYQKQRVFSFIT